MMRRGCLVFAVTVGAALTFAAFAPRLHRIKVIPGSVRVFAQADSLVVGIGVLVAGWNGGALESLRWQLSGLVGYGTYLAVDQRRELWLWRVSEGGCIERKLRDLDSYSIYPVDDELLFVRRRAIERWTGEELVPMEDSEAARLRARYPVLSKARLDSSWTVEELNLWSGRREEIAIGAYRVVAVQSELPQGIYYENVIEITVLRGEEVLCRAREGTALWRAVDGATYEALFEGVAGSQAPLPLSP